MLEFNQKKLGFGLMRLPLTDPSDDSSVNLHAVCDLIDRFLGKGFTYFATAWMYHDFCSEDIGEDSGQDGRGNEASRRFTEHGII